MKKQNNSFNPCDLRLLFKKWKVKFKKGQKRKK